MACLSYRAAPAPQEVVLMTISSSLCRLLALLCIDLKHKEAHHYRQSNAASCSLHR